jgi:hypothetical protein
MERYGMAGQIAGRAEPTSDQAYAARVGRRRLGLGDGRLGGLVGRAAGAVGDAAAAHVAETKALEHDATLDVPGRVLAIQAALPVGLAGEPGIEDRMAYTFIRINAQVRLMRLERVS